MKLCLVFSLSLVLTSCALLPGDEEGAAQYDVQAAAERRQAAAHGNSRGTPDNIKGIEDAERRAAKYDQQADEARDNFFYWLYDFLFN